MHEEDKVSPAVLEAGKRADKIQECVRRKASLQCTSEPKLDSCGQVLWTESPLCDDCPLKTEKG